MLCYLFGVAGAVFGAEFADNDHDDVDDPSDAEADITKNKYVDADFTEEDRDDEQRLFKKSLFVT